MGTNYYLHENICPHCGRGDDPLHIGKSSGGWCFALHAIPGKGLNSLEDWKKKFKEGGKIINEYGDRVLEHEMVRIITEREWHRVPLSKATLEANFAESGSNNLARHALGQGCIGHGEGTWDLIEGEFS